ncbi:DUF2934 domain-containing protein [Mesorhizobium sp. M1D.F.Ca.ET.043.01.1.1]|uniref:DUF2934 domain-containing protein n=1 Tax=Mesorhizobium sp. M1D.F.Ca.ET.043.01.1.1 TaxID=2493669 RepID=UPI000F75D0B8|nr:DUF2934 domain-containing protein [Mesorhizobium sp. M1D.F.Ca.ET.043.01.1.1]AZO71294.1 DUF2934 domain-containing protein [Mesorhizobium sp. M1D.F.Ca.ET.043.01.1.1]
MPGQARGAQPWTGEERIRRRLHEIWERKGRPEGRQTEHWDQAVQEIESEGSKANRRLSRSLCALCFPPFLHWLARSSLSLPALVRRRQAPAEGMHPALTWRGLDWSKRGHKIFRGEHRSLLSVLFA